MNVVVFDTICYIIEYLKVIGAILIFGTEYRSKKKALAVSLISVLFFMGASVFIRLTDVIFGVTAAIMLSIFLILKNKKDTIAVFIIYMYICIMDMVINSFIMYITHIGTDRIQSDKLIYVIFNLPMLAVIAIILLIKGIANIRFTYEFNRYNLLVLLVGGGAIALYISSLQLYAFSDSNKRFVKIETVAISLFSVIFMTVFFKLIVSEVKNKNLRRENEVINNMLDMQKNYYLTLLKKENENRAFRHDLGHHFFCLKALYKMDKKDEFENYFFSIVEKYNSMSNKTITGNNLIDVIINEMICNYEAVDFTKKGYVPENLSVSASDICTILSNILKNAFEAAEKTDEKKVSLIIGEKNNSILITLKNSASSAPVMKDGDYVSSKVGDLHGYGIRNVKKCIDKLDGLFEMEYSEKDSTVTVNILMVNVIPMNNSLEV